MIRLVVIAALTGCGSRAPRDSGPKPAPAPRPSLDPTFTFLAGNGAVAVGTPIFAHVGWDSNCTYGTRLCYQMPQAVEARCHDDACNGRGEHGASFHITPTKTGSLRGTVTLRATDDSYAMVFPFEIEAVSPDGATATCVRRPDHVLLTLELTHAGTHVRSAATAVTASGQPCTLQSPITTGGPEAPAHEHRYTCPLDARELRIETPVFQLNAACP